MNYLQATQGYDDQVKRLRKIEALDKGPRKGIPGKVDAVHSLTFYDSLRTYISSECLASGPFDVNFSKLVAINGQVDNYKIYLLDGYLDPKQEIIIVQRGTTARIINDFGVDLTFDYNSTPEATRNLAASLAILLLNDNKTVDKALIDLLHPRKDKIKSDF